MKTFHQGLSAVLEDKMRGLGACFFLPCRVIAHRQSQRLYRAKGFGERSEYTNANQVTQCIKSRLRQNSDPRFPFFSLLQCTADPPLSDAQIIMTSKHYITYLSLFPLLTYSIPFNTTPLTYPHQNDTNPFTLPIPISEWPAPKTYPSRLDPTLTFHITPGPPSSLTPAIRRQTIADYSSICKVFTNTMHPSWPIRRPWSKSRGLVTLALQVRTRMLEGQLSSTLWDLFDLFFCYSIRGLVVEIRKEDEVLGVLIVGVEDFVGGREGR